jgi:hypothetical protein
MLAINVGNANAAAPANCAANGGFSGARVGFTANSFMTQNVGMPWDQEDYDTDSYHDNTTNKSRLTAPVTGYYDVGSAWRGTVDFSQLTELWVNGVFVQQMSTAANAHSGSNQTQLKLNAGDYVEIRPSGNGNTMRADSSHAWISWIGQCTASSGGATTLHDLTDVNDTGKTDGSVLKFNAASSQWIVASDLQGTAGGSVDTTGTDSRLDVLIGIALVAFGFGASIYALSYLRRPQFGVHSA